MSDNTKVHYFPLTAHAEVFYSPFVFVTQHYANVYARLNYLKNH